jgi:hypothetical protein
MVRAPRTRGEQHALLLRCVLVAEGDIETRRVALHASRSLFGARLAAAAGAVLALLAVSEVDPEFATVGLLWLALVLTVYRKLNEAAFAAGLTLQRWLTDAVARPLLTATLFALSLAAWDVSTVPASLLGSAAVLEVYGHFAFRRVRAAVVGRSVARSLS